MRTGVRGRGKIRGVILIADDEPGIVAFIRRHLENEGYEILVAARGDDVLRLVDEQPDLIESPRILVTSVVSKRRHMLRKNYQNSLQLPVPVHIYVILSMSG